MSYAKRTDAGTKPVKAHRYQAMVNALCKADGLPLPAPEFVFAYPRKWQFDFAWCMQGVALEIQGGVFTQGRHTRGAALLKEHEKLNTAAAGGWRVLFATPQTLAEVWPLVVQAVRP